jgi:nitrate/nitrite transporter NarK
MAKQIGPTGTAAPVDRRRAWLVFTVVFLASTAAPFNQAKVPPLIPVLREDLGLSIVEAGLLMSVFSFAGMLIALPAGLLFRRFGPTLTGVASVGCTALGSLSGALAPNGQVLLASRLIEGIGMGMTPVLALATIAAWFPVGQRGLAVGIFSAWIPLGNFLMFITAPPVYEAFGWRAVWVVGGAIALAIALLFPLLVSLPAGRSEARAAEAVPWHHGMNNVNAWLLSLAFAAYQGSRVGFLTWAPTYLVSQAGFDLATASQLTSANVGVTIPLTLAVG